MILARLKSIIARERLSLRGAIGNAVIVGFGLFATRISALMLSLLVARVFDKDTFGIFTIFTTILLLATEIPNGLDTAYIRFANEPNRKISPLLYRAAAFKSKIIYAIIIVSLSMLALDMIIVVENEEVIIRAIIAGSMLCIFSSLVAKYQQTKKFKYLSILRPVPNVAILLGIAVLIVSSDNIEFDVVINFILAISLIIAVLVIIINRALLFNSVKKIYKEYAKVAFIILITSVITMIAARFDIFILTNYIELADLAEYGAGMRVALIVSMATGIIAVILTPKAPEVQTERKRFNRYLGLSAFYALGQTLIAIALIIWIEPVMVLLFGEAYNTQLTRIVASLLVLQMLLTSYGIPFQALVQSGTRPKDMLAISLVRAVLTVFLLLFIVPSSGAIGAAAVLMCVAAFSTTLVIFVSLRTCRPKVST